MNGVVRAKRPTRLPVVLTREEARSVLGMLQGTEWIMTILLYGAGLRLMEYLRLRVKDLDFSRNEIRVRAGKGDRFQRESGVLREESPAPETSQPALTATSPVLMAMSTG
jgi:integrase